MADEDGEPGPVVPGHELTTSRHHLDTPGWSNMPTLVATAALYNMFCCWTGEWARRLRDFTEIDNTGNNTHTDTVN